MKKYTLLIGIIGIFFVIQPIKAQTWTAAKRLTWTSGSSYSPAIAVDSGNTIHMVLHDDTPGKPEIYYKRSTNGGVSWSGIKRLTWNSTWSYSPAISLDSSNNIHIVWHDYTPGNPDIYYKRSTDGGITWGGTKRLIWTSGNSFNPAIAVDSSDNIHLVWLDDTPGNLEIFYKKSTDGGITWGGAKRLTWNAGTSLSPAIAVDSSDNIHLVWYDYTPGDSEIFYKRSTNGGMSWSGTMRLTWNAGGSLSPAIAVDSSSNVYVVWPDYTSGNVEIYYKRSTNGGVKWGGDKRLTWNAGESGDPAIAVDSNSRLHVVWNDKYPGDAEIYYKKSTDKGVSWTTKRLTWNSGDSLRPDIFVDSNKNIHVVWCDITPGNFEIYYRKGIQ
jgi:hypothetical protein